MMYVDALVSDDVHQDPPSLVYILLRITPLIVVATSRSGPLSLSGDRVCGLIIKPTTSNSSYSTFVGLRACLCSKTQSLTKGIRTSIVAVVSCFTPTSELPRVHEGKPTATTMCRPLVKIEVVKVTESVVSAE